MKIDIQKQPNSDDSDFVKWLLVRIKKVIYNSIDSKKCEKFDLLLQSFLDTKLSTYTILKNAVGSIGVREYNDFYTIEFDDCKYKNQTYAKIVSMVTYGNMSVSGYTIFEDTFKFFVDNLHTYYQIYKGIKK